jgi:hypothetical protein
MLILMVLHQFSLKTFHLGYHGQRVRKVRVFLAYLTILCSIWMIFVSSNVVIEDRGLKFINRN